MIQAIKNSTHHARAAIADFIRRLASRFAPPQEAPRDIPDYGDIDTAQFPPFTRTGEEAFLIWQLPPAGVLKKRVFTRVNKTGQVPTSLEMYQLTGVGKILRRIDFTLVDDFGVAGSPDQLKGRCHGCGRVSFYSVPCDECKVLCCPECVVRVEESSSRHTRCLCKHHARIARWNRDLWAEEGR